MSNSNHHFTATNPRISGGVADRDSTYSLARKAFFNKTYDSHQSANQKQNLIYSANDLANKQEHRRLGYANMQTFNPGFSKPLPNQSGDLRIQRLRMMAIGGSARTIPINPSPISTDKNFIHTALTRVRAGGSIAPKKKGG